MSQRRREQLTQQDALARRQAQREFGLPMVVEAGAGTGKTSILVARMITWCLGPGWERIEEADADPLATAAEVAQGMVAMTFTEAAAAEMAQRLADGLLAISDGDTPTGVDLDCLPPEAIAGERARALGAELFRVRVRTIHSLCNSLLQSYPVEARMDPRFTVDEGGHEAETEALAVVDEATRKALGQNPDPRWLRLAALGIGPRKLAAAVTELAGQGGTAPTVASKPFNKAAVTELVTHLGQRLRAFEAADNGSLASAARATAAVAAREVITALTETTAAGRLHDEDSLAELVAMISEGAVKKVKAWATGKFGKAELAALDGREAATAAAAAELAPLLQAMKKIRVRELNDAADVVGELLVITNERLRARGITTFDALLLETRDLLRDHEWLRREVRLGISQLLVDEFQDTDAIQCDIIRFLALDGPAAERPGLFIVGDPKQSIYGWRNADLRAYEDFVASLEKAGGNRHRLSVNYRSAPAILDEVERVVSRVMAAEDGLQPDFQPLVPCPAKSEDPGIDVSPWSAVEHWVTWPEEVVRGQGAGNANQAIALEADNLARDLVALHRRAEVPWNEIAVLLRATTELDTILEALRKARVPYTVARDREYYRRREVIEAAALVRVIIDPSDHLALVTILRSDIVGVPDGALVPLWREGFAATMLRSVGRNADSELAAVNAAVDRASQEISGWIPDLHRLPRWPDALKYAAGCVIDLRRSFAADPPDVFCERLRASLAAEATAAARYLGHYRRARLDSFFAELEKQLIEGPGGRAGLSRFLRRAVDEGYESTETSPSAQVNESVQVMTMHKAKGLDFDHVYVLQLHRGSGGGFGTAPAEVLRWGDAAAIRLFGWPSPGAILADEWSDRVERAEQVRLLYVAMTRARKRLVLGGAWPGAMKLRTSGPRFVDLIADEATQAAMIDQAEAAIERRRDGTVQSVQWVLPALADPTTATPAQTARIPGPSPEAVIEQAELLHQRRQRSSLRMKRPWSLGASAEAHDVKRDLHDRIEQQAPVHRPISAAAVGTLVHHLMETLDLERALAEQISERRVELMTTLADEVGPDRFEAACRRLDEILTRVETGRCLARLEQIAGQVVCRELAVLAPAREDDGAVGFLIGRADLVYEDPDTGELVVADFKTDAVAGGEETRRRAQSYRSQIDAYRTAVAAGLGSDTPTRGELWFLNADEIVVVNGSTSDGEEP